MTGPLAAGLIDVHTHVFDPDLPGFHREDVPTVRQRDHGAIEIWHAGRPYRQLDERSWSISGRLSDMDAEGVALQVLSPTPIALCPNTDASTAERLASHQNDFLARLVAAAPDRFRAFGQVPLQSPTAAAEELDRCLDELGFVGVEIGTQVGDLPLSHAELRPFWHAADRRSAVVFLHPLDHCVDPRIAASGGGFGLGMPTETARAATDLLLSGTLEQHPGVRLLLAHGGGSLPAVLARLAFGQTILGSAATPVLEAARRLWCDSLTYSADSLILSMQRFGSDHVVVGTDYPFSAREIPAGAVLGDERFPGAAADGIRHRNARSLLGLDSAPFPPDKEIR